MNLTAPIVHTAPTREGQAVFRAVLDAMARPGTVFLLSATERAPAFAVLRALADNEVTVAVPGDPVLERQLSLSTGSRAASVGEAAYVWFPSDPGEALLGLSRGEPETPEDGATAVITAASVGEGALWLALAGPGIRDAAQLCLDGVSAATIAARNAACAAYPLGIDLVFVDARGRCAALPRTTTVQVEEA
jgi:alpha-D-ribose 1-methylphosphonate 5-triphosphate synthase subunit PhnH